VTLFRVLPAPAAALLLACACVPPALAQPPAAAPAATAGAQDDRITVNFVNADIQSVIKTVGQHTGRNFILDPRVTGTVNIVSERPVSRDMLYQLLLSTLRVQGYAAVEENGFVKIVPEAEGKTSGGPVGADAARAMSGRIVTRARCSWCRCFARW
jgi:general secretion pathway protein D